MYITIIKKWTEVQTAYQVAKLGTVSAAAQALGCHRATINRHVDMLEEELGARVFIRHARAYTITEHGEAVCSVEISINTDAILSGIGIGFLNDSDIEGYSDLHAILPANDAWVATIWLVTHVDLHRTPKVQTMLNYLKQSSSSVQHKASFNFVFA
jgi:DNA-binding transcriptional LysR family regulator